MTTSVTARQKQEALLLLANAASLSVAGTFGLLVVLVYFLAFCRVFPAHWGSPAYYVFWCLLMIAAVSASAYCALSPLSFLVAAKTGKEDSKAIAALPIVTLAFVAGLALVLFTFPTEIFFLGLFAFGLFEVAACVAMYAKSFPTTQALWRDVRARKVIRLGCGKESHSASVVDREGASQS